MSSGFLRGDPDNGFTQVVGIGGIGTGIIFELEEEHTLGRNESRLARRLEARDYCKLHIVEHYIARLMGSRQPDSRFRVIAVGSVGGDPAGEGLLTEMKQAGIDIRHVSVNHERNTLFSVCFLYPDRSGGNITASNSAADTLTIEQLSRCRKEIEEVGTRGIALCLPEVPLQVRRDFLQIATESHSYRVASFTSADMNNLRHLKLLHQIDLLALNRDEAVALAESYSYPSSSDLLSACSQIANASNPQMKILLSGGADGVYVFDTGSWTHHKGISLEVISTAGAGDALLAGVLSGLAAGMPLRKESDAEDKSQFNSAIHLGIALASMSITSPHTIHPTADLDTLLSFVKEKKLLISALQGNSVRLVASPAGGDDGTRQ